MGSGVLWKGLTNSSACLGQSENPEEIQEMLFIDFVPKQLTAIEAVISEIRYFGTEGADASFSLLVHTYNFMLR